MDQNYYLNMCRLCLSEPGMLAIFETEDLPENIYMCTGLQFMIPDKLPNKICDKCYDIIKNDFVFREMACKNDRNLKAVVENINKERDDPNSFRRITIMKECITANDIHYIAAITEKKVDHRSRNKSMSPESRMKLQKELIQLRIETLNKHYSHQCSVCEMKFDSCKKLYSHSRLHNQDTECTLETCFNIFGTKGDLEKRETTPTEEKQPECKYCQRKKSKRGKALKSDAEALSSDADALMSDDEAMKGYTVVLKSDTDEWTTDTEDD